MQTKNTREEAAVARVEAEVEVVAVMGEVVMELEATNLEWVDKAAQVEATIFIRRLLVCQVLALSLKVKLTVRQV